MKTETHLGIWVRGFLYVMLALVPVIKGGILGHEAVFLIVLDCLYSGGLVIRSFMDKSPAQGPAPLPSDDSRVGQRVGDLIAFAPIGAKEDKEEVVEPTKDATFPDKDNING